MKPQRQTFLVILPFTLCLVAALVLDAAAQQQNEFSKADIASAVERELRTDDTVSAQLVDAAVADGILTLSGRVPTMLDRDRAVEIAGSIRGVRAVIDTITVTPVLRPDTEIKRDVELALSSDPATDAAEVDVKTDGGVVSLSGVVESWTEKLLVEDVVKSVRGVRDISSDDMRIVYRIQRPDAEIQAEIEGRFARSPYLDKNSIEVEVDDGVVHLSGKVCSVAEKILARNNAWVSNVNAVKDLSLQVDYAAIAGRKRRDAPGRPSDSDILAAVRAAFDDDPRVKAFKLHVDVEKNIVTLRGTVDNLQAKRAAGQDARNTFGVLLVKNHLKVRPDGKVSDSDIAEKITAALQRDAHLEKADLTFRVLNGTAYLYGSADSAYERERAGNVVSKVKGVVAIRNNILVGGQWTLKSDERIRQDVEQGLYWNALIQKENFTVSVTDGVVLLEGAAGSRREYMEAVAECFKGGARAVGSSLTINGQPGLCTEFYSYADFWKGLP